jgi:hypothetical protein
VSTHAAARTSHISAFWVQEVKDIISQVCQLTRHFTLKQISLFDVHFWIPSVDVVEIFRRSSRGPLIEIKSELQPGRRAQWTAAKQPEHLTSA